MYETHRYTVVDNQATERTKRNQDSDMVAYGAVRQGIVSSFIEGSDDGIHEEALLKDQHIQNGHEQMREHNAHLLAVKNNSAEMLERSAATSSRASTVVPSLSNACDDAIEDIRVLTDNTTAYLSANDGSNKKSKSSRAVASAIAEIQENLKELAMKFVPEGD
jgi:hypothetical protein